MFYEKLRQLRKRSGWTQAQLACQLDISTSAVGMYEQGRRMPDANLLTKIAHLFGVSVGYLVDEQPERSLQKVDELPEWVGELLREQDGLMFCGQPVDADDIDMIVQAIRDGIHKAFTDQDDR